MADKAPELVTKEEKIAQAKEHYARGYRNYVVGDFNEAAEDLSRSCELYAELYGDESEEVAIPNLFYGKTLIELAQMGENKVLALPDEEEVADDEEEENGEAHDDSDDFDENDASSKLASIPEENVSGEGAGSNNEAGSSNGAESSTTEQQPGPSTSSGTQNGNGAGPSNNDTIEEEANENLQFAWEALEMAAKIFRRLGENYEEYLAEAHLGLGEILMENQNCADALKDFNIAYEICSKAEPIKERRLAEIKYKTGLCHYSGMCYDQSIVDFQKSAEYMKQAIEAQKKLEQTPIVEQTIDDLTKMREDILIKIADVQESKTLVMNSLLGVTSSSDGAGSSNSSSATATATGGQSGDKPKANDISHLIKRKKPDTAAEATATDGVSPAKKPAI